ncbi:MAG: flavin-containing monooxygenase [Haloechinothrix sp.]
MSDYEVVIVGAGFSGIGAAIRLRDAGITDFVILEGADDVGGTWRDNTYPGVAVDIPLIYSYGFDQNARATRFFPPGGEIKEYADRCVAKHRLEPYIRFGARVSRADFDEADHVWRISIESQDTITARFLVSATGIFTQPRPPGIRGVEDFTGHTIHTAAWDHDYDLTGKRAAIIGTGASALQVIPEIARELAHLDVYQRTPIWVLPKVDFTIPKALRWLFERIPLIQTAVRLGANAVVESIFVVAVVHYQQVPLLARTAENIATKHLRRQVRDPGLRDKLLPRYGFGCKRPSISNRYWRTFERPNVELVTEPIERITPTGIRTRDGVERRIDTLILATGFRTSERGNIPTFPTYGLGGVELGEFWEANRLQAYEGITTPNMPNLWLMFGPYAFSGASYFTLIDAASSHLVRCIKEARRRDATFVAVRQEAHERYFAKMLDRARRTIFTNHCAGSRSYYFDKRGDTPLLRPSTTIETWWRSRKFDLNDYRFETAGVAASAEQQV